MHRLKRILTEEDGAVMVEYVIMAGFIAAVCAGTVYLLGEATRDLFLPVLPGFG